MKKFLVILLALTMVLAFAACTVKDSEGDDTNADTSTDTAADSVSDTAADTAADTTGDEVAVMSYADYVAAAIDDEVVIEAYVQGKQSWWENEGVGVATIYTQNEEGAYFLYEMPISEEDYAKLVLGTKIRVSGYKAEWSGEVEIIDATYEILEGDTFVAEPVDLTDKLGAEELIDYQNQLASFKGMTVESISYKDSEWDPDIYVTLSLNGASYDFCVENYLYGPDSEVYQAVAALETGAVIDVDGFVYWYEGVNPHITSVTVVE